MSQCHARAMLGETTPTRPHWVKGGLGLSLQQFNFAVENEASFLKSQQMSSRIAPSVSTMLCTGVGSLYPKQHLHRHLQTQA